MAKKETAICKTCGKSFEYYRSTLRGKDGQFCSRKCIVLTANKTSFKNQDKLEKASCLNCDKEFEYYPTTRSGKYCSQKCFHKHHDSTTHLPEPMYGEDNPAWKGGITQETQRQRKEFVKMIHKQVLKRDNYTCQMCHIRGGKLQVDHIQPWSEYVELRFNIDNCRTVCRSCHYELTYGKPMPENTVWGLVHKTDYLEERN